MSRLHLVFHESLCLGCDACVRSCQEEHLLPFDISWITVEREPVPGSDDRRFMLSVCRHCDEPDCLPACGEGALSRDEDGVVLMNDRRCSGCGACVEACPFDALHLSALRAVPPSSNFMSEKQERLRLHWATRAERRVPTKCSLCPERRAANRPPACVAACPSAALLMSDSAE